MAAKQVRKRLEGPARRDQILLAAKDLFLSEGIERTSMRNIAGRAGITPALIYQHFTDKDALLAAITEDYFETLIAYMDREAAGAADPIARLQGYMRAYARCGFDHAKEYQLAFMTSLPRLTVGTMRDKLAARRAGEAPAADNLHRAVASYALIEDAIAGVIAAGLARGTMADIELLAQAVWAAGHGLVSLRITHPKFGWADDETLIARQIDTVLHGLLRPESSA